MFVGISLILCYRVTNIPENGRWAWMGLFIAEVWFSFYWIITQSVRWNPIYRRTFKERLQQRCGTEFPGIDIFVCTADPSAEPPSMVISTVLSLLSYDYPANKISVYLSDDAGSELTFYALCEVSRFAKYWLPFCRKFKVEPRSPSAYFSGSGESREPCNPKQLSSIKEMYEAMTNRVDSAVSLGKVSKEYKQHKGFSDWNSTMTSRNHHSIVQILIDGREEGLVDIDGNRLPTLVYMAREKRPQYHHNFKAGAMNSLIRVSSEISNNPIILNVDCDMYSNNSESIRDALCFFLDEEKGHEIGFVQFPQNFDNITKNDLYANSLNVINKVELHGLDSWGGPMYIGTGCFHRRESLCGREYIKDYKDDWKITTETVKESPSILEERAKALATCTYEQNTLWGKQIGLNYGCAVEDVLTGLSIHCRGWKSVYYNPAKKGFLGVAPTTLAQTLVQHKRWAEGLLQMFTSNYCPFIYGHGMMTLGLQMGYSMYGLWAANSFPSLYYLAIPSLCLLKGVSLFPKVFSLWFLPFAYVTFAKQAYSLVESLLCGDTLFGWWNTQRMWVLKRLTSYLFATIGNIFYHMGISQTSFALTTKVAEVEGSKRYDEEVIEFGVSSPMFTIVATYALLNLVCLVGGMKMLVVDKVAEDDMLLQLLLCGTIVIINAPVYDALFLRKDKGSMPINVIVSSLVCAALACMLPIV